MERRHEETRRSKSEPRGEGDAPDTRTMTILERYAAGGNLGAAGGHERWGLGRPSMTYSLALLRRVCLCRHRRLTMLRARSQGCVPFTAHTGHAGRFRS